MGCVLNDSWRSAGGFSGIFALRCSVCGLTLHRLWVTSAAGGNLSSNSRFPIRNAMIWKSRLLD
jgi:hypothetical protein